MQEKELHDRVFGSVPSQAQKKFLSSPRAEATSA